MKGVKKAAKLGIRWKLITYFALFVAVILVLLWLFQTVFLDSFYKAIKTRNAQTCGDSIVSKINSPNLGDYINELARQNDVCVRVVNGEMRDLYSADISPDCLIHHYGTFQLFLIYNYTKENGGMRFETVPQTQYQAFYSSDFGGQEIGLYPFSDDDLQMGQLTTGESAMESLIYSRIVKTEAGQEVLVLLNSTITPINPTVQTIQVELALITIVALLLSLVLAVVLSQKISKPIIKTNNAAKELAQGNYEASFEGGDYREIRELNSTLSYAASELSKVEALRKELIANISHDLRTPLTMIGGYSEMMRDIPGENTPENAQIILDETTRLTNLVNDMLNLSRLQSGTQTLTLTEFSLTQEIREILARYNSLTKRDGYHIVFDYKEDVTVEADQVRMSQVIYNLVNNAVTYTPEGSRITVSARRAERGQQPGSVGLVAVSVADDGPGIAPADRTEIFTMFYKGKNVGSDARRGMGLGLALCKSIVEIHGGTIAVDALPERERTSPDRPGTVITFTLPAVEYEADHAEAEQRAAAVAAGAYDEGGGA